MVPGSASKGGLKKQKQETRQTRSSRSLMFFKIGALKILQYSQETTCAEVSLSKICNPDGLHRYKKETPTNAFFCEYYKIYKNILFYRTHQVAASGKQIKINSLTISLSLSSNAYIANYCKTFSVMVCKIRH